jgi:hypothetical protein
MHTVVCIVLLMSTTTKTATCKRCHATLTAPASVAAGIGPRCAAIQAATRGLKPEQTAKALELIADHGITPTGHHGVYRVTSTDGSTTYLTAVTGHCTCAWGTRRHTALAKTCYHVAAARITARPRIRRAA